jgi:hypothetical protein
MNKTHKVAALGLVVMGLSFAAPLAAQARGSAYWASRPQAKAVCIRHRDGFPKGRPYRCEPTGTTTNRGISINLPGDRGTVRF